PEIITRSAPARTRQSSVVVGWASAIHITKVPPTAITIATGSARALSGVRRTTNRTVSSARNASVKSSWPSASTCSNDVSKPGSTGVSQSRASLLRLENVIVPNSTAGSKRSRINLGVGRHAAGVALKLLSMMTQAAEDAEKLQDRWRENDHKHGREDAHDKRYQHLHRRLSGLVFGRLPTADAQLLRLNRERVGHVRPKLVRLQQRGHEE